jgi:hypothetical protein
VDGDGDLDLAVGNCGSNNEVYLNNGTALATTPAWTSSNSLYTFSVAWGDVDGDGNLDLAVGNALINEVYLNNGTALATTPAWTSSNSLYTYSVAWGDVDGDGDLDLAVGNNGNNEIYLNLGTALATTPAWTSSNSLYTYSVAWGDVDGDGDLDLAVGNDDINEIYHTSPDTDGDWFIDDNDAIDSDPTQFANSDGDGHGDNPQGRMYDSCTGYWGDSWRDRWGCPDMDSDGQSDLYDDFMTKDTQWIDSDGDGLGDNWGDANWNSSRNQSWPGQFINNAFKPDPSPFDYDNDGYEDSSLEGEGAAGPFDDCLLIYGSSTEDQSGCVDSDGDGWSDDGDSHPGDGTQHSDNDGDGYGDSLSGNLHDACPSEAGNSTRGMGYGCPDGDGDGWDDVSDDFPNESTQWSDADGDGYGDEPTGNEPDAFPNDALEWEDSDGDGRGDNSDAFPNNSTEWSDLDSDGYGDNVDECPYAWGNTTSIQDIGCPDSDADGIADRSDAFSGDLTQWFDSDGDGFGDDPNGTQADDCPSLAGSSLWNVVDGERVNLLGCADGDGDGYVDPSDDCPVSAGSSQGIIWGCPDADGDGTEDLEDDCPTLTGTSTVNLRACPDSDGDGIADLEDPLPLNGTGTADDWDGDLYNNSVDVFPFDETQWADSDGDGLGDESTGRNPDLSPGDYDNDGRLDPSDLSTDELGCLLHPEEGKDDFPHDILEWSDFDGDCIGDNADADDDNDGYSDDAEFLAGTDSFSSADKPVETFELVMPGTTIGLGAWDLIGMLGGIPLGFWILFGLVTRNGRTKTYERRLFEARTEEELSEISDAYEWSLMWKMVGPHQALRLERIRSNLEVKFNQMVQADSGIDQTSMVETSGPDSSMAGTVGTDGYEWMQEGGTNWYRPAHTGGDWTRWQ